MWAFTEHMGQLKNNYIRGGNEKKNRKEKINALRLQKLQSKRRLAHYDTAVADEGGLR